MIFIPFIAKNVYELKQDLTPNSTLIFANKEHTMRVRTKMDITKMREPRFAARTMREPRFAPRTKLVRAANLFQKSVQK